MFGASHFQKELSEKMDFWVSYCRNKFLDYKLTTSWLTTQLTTVLFIGIQVDWLQTQANYKLNTSNYRLICM